MRGDNKQENNIKSINERLTNGKINRVDVDATRVGNTTCFFRRCVPKLESFENEIFRKCNLLKLVFFFSTSPSTNPISQI